MANLKGTKTHKNLKDAFAGESQANRRYLYFARQADIEGYPDVGGLFRDTAEAETGHAHGHLDHLKVAGDPATDKSEALFRAFGQFVESLGGRYITAEDVGIDVNDMEYVYRETEYVTGVHQVHGGSGDPSPFTAYGALQGLMATLNKRFGDEEVGKYSYAVQGLGHDERGRRVVPPESRGP